jgi:UPF0271 protein
MGSIDLNSDVGEGFGAWAGGPDTELMPLLTSVNVACGFHAGDPSTIRRTCELAVEHGCTIGAQVSYPDLMGFGRRFIDMQPDDLRDAVLYQIGALDAIARAVGGEVRYVKPHGALYNAVVHHQAQARAVAEAVASCRRPIPVLGLPGSAVGDACSQVGVRFVTEGFADRTYTAEGTLVPRTQAGALITDPATAGPQALDLARRGIESICVHSDTPGAPMLLRAVSAALVGAGFIARSFV